MLENIENISTKLCVVQKLQLYNAGYWRDIATKLGNYLRLGYNPSKNEMSILIQFSPSAHLVHI